MIFVDKIVGVWYTIGMSNQPLLLPAPTMSRDLLAPAAPTVSEDLLNRWFAYLDVAPKSLETYKTNIRPFVRFLAANGITHPTRADILAYKDHLKADGKKATTIAAYLAPVRLLFGWLEQEGVCRNIASHIKSPNLSSMHKRDFVSVESSRRVLAAIPTDCLKGARDFAILALMSCTGVRCKEVSAANLGDLHTEGGDLILRVLGKGREERGDFVRVPPEVQAAISRYLSHRFDRDPDAPLFASTSRNNYGRRMTPHAVSAIAKARLRAVGMDSPRLTAHSFRHGFVTESIKAGCTLQEASHAARHNSITTTTIYDASVAAHSNPCAYTVARLVFGPPTPTSAPAPAVVAG